MPFQFVNAAEGETTVSYRYPPSAIAIFLIAFLVLGGIVAPFHFLSSISARRDDDGSVSLTIKRHPLQTPRTFTGIQNAYVEGETRRTSDGTEYHEYLMLLTEAGPQRAHSLVNRRGEQEKRAQRINALVSGDSEEQGFTLDSERVLFGDIVIGILTFLFGMASMSMLSSYCSWTFQPAKGIIAIRERGFLYWRQAQEDLSTLEGFDYKNAAATRYQRSSAAANSYDTRLMMRLADGRIRKMPPATKPRVQEAIRKIEKLQSQWTTNPSPLDAFISQKICGLCGLSSENEPRLQDEHGTYYHKTCYEAQ